MAHTTIFPINVLGDIAKQLGNSLPDFLDTEVLSDKPIIKLGETFELYTLLPDAISLSNKGVKNVTQKTNKWHHQIFFNNVAKAFARSIPKDSNPDDREIVEISYSYRAKKIHDAIEWIDENVKDDVCIHLLIVRAYQMYTFWLEESNQVVIIYCPKSLYHCLTCLKLYEMNEFLNILYKEKSMSGRICEDDKVKDNK